MPAAKTRLAKRRRGRSGFLARRSAKMKAVARRAPARRRIHAIAEPPMPALTESRDTRMDTSAPTIRTAPMASNRVGARTPSLPIVRTERNVPTIPIGRFTRKMLFQPYAVASRPPRAGPAHDARATATAVIPSALPRRDGETAPTIRALADAIMNDALSPWRIRETMRAAMVGERAENSELAVNPTNPAT